MSLPQLDFVYADHAPRNHARIIDALKSSDGHLLAIEAVGESLLERRALERVIHCTFDPECELRASDIAHLLDYGDGFIDNIVTAFEGSGKGFSLLDISSEHRVAQLIGHVHDLHKQLLHQIWDGSVSTEWQREHMRTILQLDARTVTIRDHIVVDQLRHLMARHPEQQMTIFQGAIHTRVSHALGRVASVNRTFVPSLEQFMDMPDGVVMQYTDYDLLLRNVLFGMPISDAQIDTLLEHYADQLTS